MAEYETILTAVDNGIGQITINRPDARNALNTQVLGDIRQTLAEFRHDREVGVVVFTGAGERAFAAGADIGELRQRTALDALASVMQDVYDEIEAYEKPTIAAVNGLALGGGCELAMACDVRVASGDARFGLPEVKRGLFAAGGGVFLSRRIPLANALSRRRSSVRLHTARLAGVNRSSTVRPSSMVTSETMAWPPNRSW